MKCTVAIGIALLTATLVGCGPADEGGADLASGVPLYDNLGEHGRPISTASEEAQAYFDQGLRLQYAFNHAEAIRSYEVALAHDSNCAMCWWGIALASGPNINGAMDAESGRAAFAAIGAASERAESVGEIARALIDALAARYAADPEADRAQLDSAYANAMSDVADRFPEDDDALTLYAASLMNLRPWDYWRGDYDERIPNPGTGQILRSLEVAMAIDADNPGACHYFIHAVEAAFPRRAEACADRLAELMPGAGHIVHMPGHIYIRVGRWADAVRANEHAVHSDETYIADQSPMGVYPTAYYPHNYHFMAFAATMAGMSAKAMEASVIVSPKIPKEIALQVSWIQNAIVFPHLTAVTFGDWDRILALDMPDPDLHHATAMAWYARGVAYAAKGDAVNAEAALEEVTRIGREADPDGANPVFEIARHVLQGEIALRMGTASDAVLHFRLAADIEDEMLYEEPPLWYYPIRQSLGRALLEAGQAPDAELAYREDLARFPENGWSLYGLARSLEAQGGDAQGAWEAFNEAWANADVALLSSRF